MRQQPQRSPARRARTRQIQCERRTTSTTYDAACLWPRSRQPVAGVVATFQMRLDPTFERHARNPSGAPDSHHREIRRREQLEQFRATYSQGLCGLLRAQQQLIHVEHYSSEPPARRRAWNGLAQPSQVGSTPRLRLPSATTAVVASVRSRASARLFRPSPSVRRRYGSVGVL